MTYQVMGTREKHYRVETRDDLTAWVDDEIDSMAEGWMPIASELEPDGAMRVVYGRLPEELREELPTPETVPAGRGIGTQAGRAVTSLVILGTIILAALAMLGLVARGV